MAYPNGPGNDEIDEASDADLIINFTLDMELDELANASGIVSMVKSKGANNYTSLDLIAFTLILSALALVTFMVMMASRLA